MRKILILAMFMSGCSMGHYTVWRCEVGGTQCMKGATFPTRQDCQDFVQLAAKAQPGVVRACSRTDVDWSIAD